MLPYLRQWLVCADVLEFTTPWILPLLEDHHHDLHDLPSHIKFMTVYPDTVRQFKKKFTRLDTVSFSRTDFLPWFQWGGPCVQTWTRLHTVHLDQIKCDVTMVTNIFLWIHVPTIHLSIQPSPSEWITWFNDHVLHPFLVVKTTETYDYMGCYRWESVHLSFHCLFESINELLRVETECFEWTKALIQVMHLEITWKRLSMSTYRNWQQIKLVSPFFAQTWLTQYHRHLHQGFFHHTESFFQRPESCRKKKQTRYTELRTPLFHDLTRIPSPRSSSRLTMLPVALLEYIVCQF